MSVPVEADWHRICEVLDRHRVEFIVVGGVAAALHGAQRPTKDFDSVARGDRQNLDRLADALRELGAFMRVEQLSDEEARALPTPLDGLWLSNLEISTWRTDAGDIDVLTALPTADGGRADYEQLLERAKSVQLGDTPVLIAALSDVIASKEWADRPKDREALIELRALQDDESRA